jgi:CspA family cold shock protein
MEVSTRATVRTWDDEQGWAVLDSGVTPGGCWTHFSAIDFDGYRTLSPGQQVRLVAESPGQDGYAWRAVRVAVGGKSPAAPASTAPDGAYASDLTLTMDDDEGEDA